MDNRQVPAPQKQIVPVLLCGGAGLRLRPLTTPELPKAFLRLAAQGPTLLQITAARALRVVGCAPRQMIAVTLASLAEEASAQLEAVASGAGANVVRETSARNTAAAIDLAVSHAGRIFGEDAVLWLSPIDHRIGDEAALGEALMAALPAAEAGKIVVFGIRPTEPATGYGYVRRGKALRDTVFEADGFTEKPDAETARLYLDDGAYLWNSGMVLARVGALRAALEVHGFEDGQSFDRAVLEKAANVAVVPCDLQWMDIGTRENFALAQALP